MRKATVVYERGGTLLVRARSKTTAGLTIEDGPCVTVPLTAAPEDLGRAVLVAVHSSRFGVPHPEQNAWPSLQKPVLEAAKVRSWSTFGRSARCVGVELDDQFYFTPTRHLGNKGAFTDIEDRVVHSPATSTPADVGKAVVAALALSEI